MPPTRHDPDLTPPGDDRAALERAVKRFEQAWRQGPRPTIQDHLLPGALRFRVLIELVHTDLELRLKAGEPARVEEYLTRFPELADDDAAVLGLVEAEFDLRRRIEPDLSLDEYAWRFPRQREQMVELTAGPTVIGTSSGRAATTPEHTPTVPGYEVLGLLGRGGMGVVYQARQLSLDRPVALKFLPAESARDPVWLERFWREARTASALNHPNICTIYDTGESGGRPYLCMELIRGRTLEAFAGALLAAHELAALAGQAARALAAAHAAGVIHRDVKPANVMVRDDGIVKVLDFGLARQVPSSGAATAAGRDTDPGVRAGTPLYMSPEQARGEAVGAPSDVFSLGLVLYELAAGRHPFGANSPLGVLQAIVDDEVVPPSRLNPTVPAALDTLLRQMLAKQPPLRPTAAEVEATLAELAGRSAAAATIQDRPRRVTVGRDRERAALVAAFDAAAAGRGQVVCITGEPGLGKTTVVEDFLEDLAGGARSCAVGRGRCSEVLADTEAYLPVLEALEALLRADGAVGRVLHLLARSWHALLVPGDSGASPRPDGAGPPRQRLKRELGLFLEELGRLRPVVLFFDDVHWADLSTVDLLAYLGGRCGAARLLIVLAYRPADLALAGHPFAAVQRDLQSRGVCREVALDLLAAADVARYLTLRFPSNDFGDELAAVLYRRTEGNPLFLADLVEDLCARGVIAFSRGRWSLAEALPDLLRDLPESVRALIRRKVEQLGEIDRRLLTAASLQGSEFDAAIAAAALGLDAAAAEDRLAELERVHAFVRRLREQELPDGTPTVRYAFAHGLYRAALHDALQPARRCTLSAAVAGAVVRFYGENNPAVATTLALLFEAAREFPRAAASCLRAAEQAVQVSAHREAAELARRGLTLLARLPETPERTRQELALLLARGVALVATQGFASPDVEATYLWALALCQRGDNAALAPVLYGLWNVALVRCQLARCDDLADQMFAAAQTRAEAPLLLIAHNVRQQPLFHRGDFEAARRHQEQGLALYDPPAHRALTAAFGEDPGVGCLAYSAPTLWHLGYPERALQAVAAARRLAETLGDPFNLAQALFFGALTRLWRREPARAQELAEALAALCREHDFALLLAGAHVLRGACLAARRQATEGIAQMRQGLERWQATGAVSHRPFQLGLLAEALTRQGEQAAARSLLDESLTLAEATGERFWEAELHRLRGEVVPAQAEACFRCAADIARGQQSRSLLLRATVSLARLYQQQRRTAEAREPLAELLATFTEGTDTADLRDARACLAQLQ